MVTDTEGARYMAIGFHAYLSGRPFAINKSSVPLPAPATPGAAFDLAAELLLILRMILLLLPLSFSLHLAAGGVSLDRYSDQFAQCVHNCSAFLIRVTHIPI